MKKKGSNGAVSIGCRVFPGMFSDEKAVSFDLPDGRVVSAFVHESDVVSPPPVRGSEKGVPGRLMVSVVETGRDSAVIDLPQPSIAAGTRFIVPKIFLK